VLLWVVKASSEEAERRPAVRRFGREIKRFVLCGVMQPEVGSAMIDELEAPKPRTSNRQSRPK
jgi:hypothetical protein